MGTYTELVMAVELSKDAPENMIDILEFMVGGREKPLIQLRLPDHPLFRTGLWGIMLQCDSHYFAGNTHSTFCDDHLTIRCNLQNYDLEIEWFLDWLCPYIDRWNSSFLGYMRCEEYDVPTLIYFNRYDLGCPIYFMVGEEDGQVYRKLPLNDVLRKGR